MERKKDGGSDSNCVKSEDEQGQGIPWNVDGSDCISPAGLHK